MGHRAGGSCSKINFPFMGEQVVTVSFDTLPSCGDPLLVWDWHQVHTDQGNIMSSFTLPCEYMIITYNHHLKLNLRTLATFTSMHHPFYIILLSINASSVSEIERQFVVTDCISPQIWNYCTLECVEDSLYRRLSGKQGELYWRLEQ